MNMKLIVAILVTTAMPVYAQAQPKPSGDGRTKSCRNYRQ
jgi:hypothetical protein